MTSAAPALADLPAAALVAGVFLALLASAELWRRRGRAPAEHTRKLVHAGGGLVCLSFPFLFRSPLVVVALAAGLTALFALAGRLGALRSLHGVERPSRGAELYPLAVLLVYLLARDRPWLYLAALLTLAVADAAAALVGRRYGAVRYRVEGSRKSLEGSLVFLVVAFLAIHLPMLLMTDLPRPVCVLAALLVALLVTGFEAISLGGADNLFVPLGVVVVLAKITTKPPGEVAFQLASLIVLFGLIALVAWRRRSLDVGGAIAFTLFAYGAWSLGNWQWALAPLVGFAIVVAAWFAGARRTPPPAPQPPSSPTPPGAPLGAISVVRAVLVPFLAVALANGTCDPRGWFGPYLAACGATLAFALGAGRRRRSRPVPPRVAAFDALPVAGAAGLAVALPSWLVARPALAAPFAVAAAAGVAAFLLGLRENRPGREPEGSDVAARPLEWNPARLLLAAAAAAAVWALQAGGVVPPWDPTWPVRPF